MINIESLADWPKYLGANFESASPFTVTTAQLESFLRASGDHNPLHFEDAAIVPGNLLLSLVPHFLQQHLSLADTIVGMTVGYEKVRFKAPVSPDEALTFWAEISYVRPQKAGTYVIYHIICQNARDQQVMTLEMRDYYSTNSSNRSSSSSMRSTPYFSSND